MDRLEAMDLFVRIVDAGSFAAAAERLSLSRAAASRAIFDLEQRLGTRLLNRTTRRLSLTDAGNAYYQRVKRILVDVSEAEDEAGASHVRVRGLLRITAPVSFGTRYVAPLVGEYLNRHPDVTADLSLSDRFVDLVEDGFDVAVRISQLGDSTLIARRLASCQTIVCASPTYLATNGVPHHPSDLVHHTCLGYANSPHPGFWRFDGPQGEVAVSIPCRMIGNNGEALMATVRSGCGIAIQPDFIVADDIRRGLAVRILEEWRLPEFPISAVLPPGRSMSAKVRGFVDLLAERYRDPVWTLASVKKDNVRP